LEVCIATQKYDSTLTDQVTLPYHVRFMFSFLTMLGHVQLSMVVIECKIGMLVVVGSILGQVKKNFSWK